MAKGSSGIQAKEQLIRALPATTHQAQLWVCNTLFTEEAHKPGQGTDEHQQGTPSPLHCMNVVLLKQQ